MTRKQGYETPRTPDGTPPVIAQTNEAAKAADEEIARRAGKDTPGEEKSKDGRESELDERLDKRQSLDGAGEETLDASTPATMLPPD